ncbi:hypothetical protein AAG607_10605 [Citromicrobium bathyomarinum]|jgi:predicted trehalose synthase|uniref:hypothetical protein n=1 Tax=Sphingomonadales TaxID=204457 RepID=UPI000C3B0D2A|nr:hypothetical protein [Citromicrobium sp.]MBO82375.1 hypothetical protein [Citromicrobium sp.]|tara:strand:+ start:23895 stop:24374 length:480 start_codon:yes stop_codon:yes gene_type:complete
MSTQEQRDELRRKIEESERRNEERSIADMARDATDNATEFVKAHPLLTVGAVALIGLAIGSRTSKGRELTGRAVGFADHLTDLGLAYASGMAGKVGTATRHGGDRLVDLGDDIAFGSRSARRNAAYFADRQKDAARHAGRRAARKTGRGYRDLRSALPF